MANRKSIVSTTCGSGWVFLGSPLGKGWGKGLSCGQAVNPLAGKTFLVLKDSLENILAKAGWAPAGSSTSAIRAWVHACETRNPLCQEANNQVRPYVVASAVLNGNGGFTFPNARTGTYYLFGQTLYSGLHVVWDLRVDLKPGANSVTLDQRNTTPIE